MRKIFVAGGSGFIGSSFIRLVLEKIPDCHIINFDAMTYAGNFDNLSNLDDRRYKFYYGNITDKGAVLNALDSDTDALINFAVESNIGRSITSANEFVRTNISGTQVLLDAARQRNVSRFVQISTDEVLGSLPEDPLRIFNEGSPYSPNSPYAASKAAAEHLVRAAHETFGLDTVITRCGSNYGPRQFPEKLIPLMIAKALNGEPLPVYGDGRHIRDWIYVKDHCHAILSALLYGKSGEIYNVGARNERRNLEIVLSILNIIGKPYSLINFVEDRRGHDRRLAIDPTKTEQELSWKPVETWESGLEKTVKWYLNNKHWTESIRNGEYRKLHQRNLNADVNYQHSCPSIPATR